MGRKQQTWENLKAKTQEDNSGCYNWLGCLDKDGYGISSIKGIKMPAHRASYILNHTSNDVKDKYVLHKCHNRRCINPAHLYVGTQKDNVQDQIKANTFVQGVKNGRARLKNEDIVFIRHSNLTARELASYFKVSYYTIWDILKGRTWKHLL